MEWTCHNGQKQKHWSDRELTQILADRRSGVTLEEIAKKIGRSRERTRQLIVKAWRLENPTISNDEVYRTYGGWNFLLNK